MDSAIHTVPDDHQSLREILVAEGLGHYLACDEPQCQLCDSLPADKRARLQVLLAEALLSAD